MSYWYAWLMSAVSLVIGLAVCPQIDRAIKAVTTEFKMGGAWGRVALWAVAIAVLFLVLLPLASMVASVIERIARGKKQEQLHRLVEV